MAVFSVHLPGGASANVAEAAFVREGFSRAAFLFGPFWLVARGLWLWAALWLIAFLAVVSLAAAGLLSGGAGFGLIVLLQILLGLEAGRLLEGRLWRRGFDLAGIVAAPQRDEAELAFFQQLGAAPKAAAAPGRPAAAPGVIGSLPTPEA